MMVICYCILEASYFTFFAANTPFIGGIFYFMDIFGRDLEKYDESKKKALLYFYTEII